MASTVTKPWALLVYMGVSDPKVHEQARRNLRELAGVSSSRLHIGIQADWGNGGERMEVVDGAIRTVRRLDRSRANSAHLGTFRAFLGWSQRRFPARRHLLVLLGHGLGVGFDLIEGKVERQKLRTAFEGRARRGSLKMSIQATLFHGDNGLTVDEMGKGLAERWGSDQGKLDLLAFNSCYMNAVEIAYELRKSVQFVVGCQGSLPLPGLAFRQIGQVMARRPSITPKQLGEVMVRRSVQKNWHARSAAISLLDLEKADALKSPARRLVSCLEHAIRDDGEMRAVRRAIAQAVYLEISDFVDLGDLCLKLERETESVAVRGAAAALRQRISGGARALVQFHRRAANDSPKARGVSIYFEPRPNKGTVVLVGESSYRRLEFSRDTDWARFMFSFPQIGA